ncbi:MAG TPA: prolyl oligopeptidase family serine peptidase [Bryobacteraceae bacterium]|nr:prolyl oligopeptidase family serine peptidase [Bryobacteraceae bacterium]
MRHSAALLALLLSPAAFAQEPFTLEQALSSPFPSELTAAPSGGAVAWVLNARGVRNIWVAEPPAYKSRPVTSYSSDDGQEISGVAWTPDARSLIFVRGGSANAQGENPNPLSDPAGAEQALWIVPLSGGEPRRIDDGSAPAVSPKGDRIAYLKKGQIWSAPLAGDEKPAQLIRARGQCGSLRWSPGGVLLAFVSARADHSFIGVYDPAAKTLRYLDPGLDLDSEPAWSPDGRSIAFLRVPNSRVLAIFGPKRSAEPWSVRVADVANGRGREIWRAKPGAGSVFHGVIAENQLLWAAGGRIVFPWEAGGWTHLYSVPVSGGDTLPLTSGAFEVEHVVVSPDRSEVIYSSNQDDIDRRHLWRVPVAGGRPRAITSGSGIEWSPVLLGGGATVAFFRSDARRPARAAVLNEDGPRDLAPETIPSGFPGALVIPEPIEFPAADGMKIRGQLFLPSGVRQGERRPAVIFFHGGSRRQMLLGGHYMDYYHRTYALNQYLASRGYVVLSVNYRSGTGYGLEFREALNYGAAGASEFNDVLGAGLYLRNRPDVDPARIGLWGGSYGGYLTALGLARASDLFAAGVDLHGVHDWRTETRVYVSSDDLDTQQRALRVAFESSPLAHMSGWRSPVLLIHGDDDRNVEFRQTVALAEALRKQEVDFEQLVFPDEIHGFLTHARWLEALQAAAGFFDRHLTSGAGSSR